MFSTDEKIIDFSKNSQYEIPTAIDEIHNKATLNAFTKLIASYSIIRNNCEQACNTKLLSELPESEQNDIITNSRIAQVSMKSRGDLLMQQFDSCIRRCFVQRVLQHFPDDKKMVDVAYASAFEYNQDDVFYLRSNQIYNRTKPIRLSEGRNIEKVATSVNDYLV